MDKIYQIFLPAIFWSFSLKFQKARDRKKHGFPKTVKLDKGPDSILQGKKLKHFLNKNKTLPLISKQVSFLGLGSESDLNTSQFQN